MGSASCFVRVYSSLQWTPTSRVKSFTNAGQLYERFNGWNRSLFRNSNPPETSISALLIAQMNRKGNIKKKSFSLSNLVVGFRCSSSLVLSCDVCPDGPEFRSQRKTKREITLIHFENNCTRKHIRCTNAYTASHKSRSKITGRAPMWSPIISIYFFEQEGEKERISFLFPGRSGNSLDYSQLFWVGFHHNSL